MLSTLTRRTSAALAGLLVVAPLALVGPTAQAAEPAGVRKSCSASATPSNPKQYGTVTVNVSRLSKGAKVTTKASYKTTTTTKTATANSSGKAATSYMISRATVGYRVVVNVTAKSPSGYTTWSCSTSFTPRSR